MDGCSPYQFRNVQGKILYALEYLCIDYVKGQAFLLNACSLDIIYFPTKPKNKKKLWGSSSSYRIHLEFQRCWCWHKVYIKIWTLLYVYDWSLFESVCRTGFSFSRITVYDLYQISTPWLLSNFRHYRSNFYSLGSDLHHYALPCELLDLISGRCRAWCTSG